MYSAVWTFIFYDKSSSTVQFSPCLIQQYTELSITGALILAATFVNSFIIILSVTYLHCNALSFALGYAFEFH